MIFNNDKKKTTKFGERIGVAIIQCGMNLALNKYSDIHIERHP